MGRQHQGMDRPGVHQVPEGSGKQGEMEETGCNGAIIHGAPVTLKVIDDDDDHTEGYTHFSTVNGMVVSYLYTGNRLRIFLPCGADDWAIFWGSAVQPHLVLREDSLDQSSCKQSKSALNVLVHFVVALSPCYCCLVVFFQTLHHEQTWPELFYADMVEVAKWTAVCACYLPMQHIHRT